MTLCNGSFFSKRSVFNFGPNFIRWISVLYSDVQGAIMHEWRIFNKLFPHIKGVRQGCPLSPYPFILAVEILALKIRQDANCRDIVLPNDQVVKISQFADDTTIVTFSTESLKPYLEILDWFGTLSGLRLNKKKTKAVWLGSMKHNRYWLSRPLMSP